ncbi:recombinase family protein [Candidatus Woesebacteria bacterium]|nr:recombinase family protein [Candidatus Woesebacteria bacterium]
MIRRLEQGLFPWNPPIGYYLPKNMGERLSVAKEDEACSHAIREVFNLYATGLYSFHAIAHKLNKTATYNHRGTKLKFYKQQIVTLITNPFYIGFTRNKIDNKLRKGLHTPLISTDIFEKCQQVKQGKQFSIIRKTTNENFPLKGLILGDCGHTFTGAMSSGRWGNKYGYYFCHNRDSGNHSSKTLHAKFSDLLEKIEPEKEAIDLYFEIFKEQLSTHVVSSVSEQEKLLKRIKELESKKQRLVEMRLDDDIDKDTFTTLKTGYEQELMILQTRQNEEVAVPEVNIDELTKFGKSFVTNIKDRWDSLPIEGKIAYQGSIFPEKLVWDGLDYRTPVVLEVLRGINGLKSDNVTPIGFEPMLTG